jgi:hypothetical protein
MARIRPLALEEAPPAARAELEQHAAAGGRLTNKKQTLAAATPHHFPQVSPRPGFRDRIGTSMAALPVGFPSAYPPESGQ